MKKLAKLLVLFAVCFSFMSLAIAPSVYADDAYKSTFFTDCSEGAADSGATSSGENIILCTIRVVFNWLAIGVGTVVVIMIVVGAIQYMSVADKKDQAKKGIETIRNAILALVLYMLMWAILNFIVPGEIF